MTAEALKRAKEDLEAVQGLVDDMEADDEPHGDLDKAWAGLRFLFDAAGIPVQRLGDGEPIDADGY